MFYLYINKYIALKTVCRFFSLQTANVAYFKKNSIIRIFCISGWLRVPVNPVKWGSTVYTIQSLLLTPYMISCNLDLNKTKYEHTKNGIYQLT